MKKLIYFVFLITSLITGHAIRDLCRNRKTCSSCIAEPGCSWCSAMNFSGIFHCRNSENIKSCPPSLTVSPKSTQRIVRAYAIQLKPNKTLVQITPQLVDLKLRKGEEINIVFKYGHAPNFPIDLYYMMDLSATMRKHKENLANLGGQLIKTMRAITTDFRIGFGSFVDKTVTPFIHGHPEKKKSPCKGCVPGYSFKNHQSLNNGATFSSQVKTAEVSGNVDHPEGGLDALMQVMVCKEKIGWREHARHLIVYSTDATFHIAGDGKLGGVIVPNDNKCHMINQSYNAYSTQHDYPSISQINYIASQEEYRIFFAVDEDMAVYEMYRRLKDQIKDSGVAPLRANSNLTSLIMQFYNQLSSIANIKDNSADNIEIKYTCKKADGSECTSLHSGDIVTYTAKIKLLEFSKNKHQQIIISTDIVNKGLAINLEEIHDCHCETNRSYPKDVECKNKGTIECGICKCDEGHYGTQCQCDGINDTAEDKSCINGQETIVCSGQGICKCGVCECDNRSDPNQQIYGRYCECDNYSCLKHNFKVCGGNGRCDCGKCICDSDWSGESCDCRDNSETCKRDELVCNGHGNCRCGECKCEKGYYGQYCEECATCYGGRCLELRACVECKVYNIGKYNKSECDEKCGQHSITILDEINELDSENIKICRYEVENSCNIIFRYYHPSIAIEARKEVQCPEPITFELLLVFAVFILIIGLFTLLIWKIYTYILDEREYATFLHEGTNSKWHREENPLYKSANVSYRNPLYEKY